MTTGDQQRIAEVIRCLDLRPHPEGGQYRETFRSTSTVNLARGERAASTAIWFLLQAGEVSRWHRILADEIWHWHEGHPVALACCQQPGADIAVHQLGPLSTHSSPQIVIPGGWWQAARPLGAYALMGCTVAPGFSFEDFALLDPHSDDAAWFRAESAADLVDGPA